MKTSQTLQLKATLSKEMKQHIKLLSYNQAQLENHITALDNPFLEQTETSQSEKKSKVPRKIDTDAQGNLAFIKFASISQNSKTPTKTEPDKYREQILENNINNTENSSLQNHLYLQFQEEFPLQFEKIFANTIESIESIESIKSIKKEKYEEKMIMTQSSSLYEECTLIAQILISAVDSKGLLQIDLQTLFSSELEKNPQFIQRVEKIRNFIQQLEPIACVSLHIQECLHIQAMQVFPQDALLLSLLADKEYFTAIMNLNFLKIQRHTKLGFSDVRNIFLKVRRLNPYPAFSYQQYQVKSNLANEIAELSIKKVQQTYDITYNDMFSFKINQMYEEEAQKDKQLREKLFQAKQIIENIEYRKNKLLQMMRFITKHQAEFFDSKGNFELLKPLTLAEIASQLEVHVSTISRLVANKYVQTSWKQYKISSFFSASISNSSTHTHISNQAMKSILMKIIENEDKIRPHTDDEIVKIIAKKRNISLARRTITKYRNQLLIPKHTIRQRIYTLKLA